MKCEIWNRINELFVFCYIKMHWSLLNFEFTFYPCMILSLCALVICKIVGPLSYARLTKCWHISFYNIKKLHFLISPLISSDESINYWEAVKLSGTCKVSKIFLESSNFIIGTNIVSCFLGVTISLCQCLRNCLPNTQVRISIFQVKMMLYEKKKVNSAHNKWL